MNIILAKYIYMERFPLALHSRLLSYVQRYLAQAPQLSCGAVRCEQRSASTCAMMKAHSSFGKAVVLFVRPRTLGCCGKYLHGVSAEQIHLGTRTPSGAVRVSASTSEGNPPTQISVGLQQSPPWRHMSSVQRTAPNPP